MAYVEKYFTKWVDSESKEHEIKLLNDGASAGTTALEIQSLTPYEYFVRGSKTSQIEDQVFGREMLFDFIIPSTNLAAIEAIIDSDYKQWRMDHYLASSLDGTFWLQADNFSRNYIKNGDYYEISLSGVDGLGNVKNVEYVNASDGSQYTDRVSLIETIKRCLEHIGLELDFRVQLNTWCTNDSLMLVDDCSLDKVDSDSRRFAKEKDGRATNTDCYEVISELLEPYNCYLMQSEGFYWIIDPQEVNSHYYPIAWSDLAVLPRVSNDLRVELTTDHFENLGEAQRIRPIATIGVTFRDRNVRDNSLTNGDFHLQNTNEWVNGNMSILNAQAFGDNYEMRAVYAVEVHGVPAETPNFHSIAQAIVVRGEADQIQVQATLRCHDIDMDEAWTGDSFNERVKVSCQIRKGTFDGDIITSGISEIILGEPDAAPTLYAWFFDISEDDDYFIEFLVDKMSANDWTDYDAFSIAFDDIDIIAAYSTGEDITFDSYKKITNADNNNIDFKDIDLKFGDSASDTDIGAFKIGGTRTETWNRYTKTENQSIQKLSGINILENFALYKDYLRLSIFDQTDKISPHSIITIDGKNYQQVNQNVRHPVKLQKRIEVELVEILNDAISVTVVDFGLSSVDGGTDSSSPPSGAVTNLYTNPSQVGLYEPVISPKNTAFNQNYGITANTVAQGNHQTHSLQNVTDVGNLTTKNIGITSALDSYFTGGGNIGIGTDNIATRLTIKGSALDNTGGIRLIKSSTDAAYYDTYINAPAELVWAYLGTDLMALTAAGRVGINKTSPDEKLHVVGNVKINDTVLSTNPVTLGGTVGSFVITGGSTGSYEGYSIAGQVAFIWDNDFQLGIWDEANSNWVLFAEIGGQVELYYAGVKKFETNANGVRVTGDISITSDIFATNLSTSDPVVSGKFWNENGFVRVSAG